MTNRDRLAERLRSGKLSARLREEIDYQLHDIDDREDPDYDIVDAFFDTTSPLNGGGFRVEERNILIELGYYRPMTPREIANTVCMGGKSWSFSKQGVKYRNSCGSLYGWLGEEYVVGAE